MSARLREDDGEVEGWRDYKRLVLDGLDFLREDSRSIRSDVTEIKIALAKLQTRAAIWGAVWGGLAGIVATAIAGAIVMKVFG